MTVRRRTGRLLRTGFMLAIRYTPLPWTVKQTIIHALSPKTLVAGLAVIPDGDGRVLMVRARYSGRWILPGGTLHPGEGPLAGTRRECREELGLPVTVEHLTGVYARSRPRELLMVFRCAPLAGTPSLSEEHDAWQYQRLDRLRPPVDTLVGDALAPPDGIRIARLPG
jgi:8-oxo-dGTP pyrophosphatase MutT (NUDIX family)